MCMQCGHFINRSTYPLSESPAYRCLVEAEDHGRFSLSTEEILSRCKASDATICETDIAADIDALLACDRIVRHGTHVLTKNTWEDENKLAEHLAMLVHNNESQRPGFMGPFPIESGLAPDHPMKRIIEDAALVHLTHKLSLAIVDSPQEMKWLARALDIRTGMIIPFYVNAVCATTQWGAEAIHKKMNWRVYGLPTVLHSNMPIDEVDFGRCRVRALWKTATVILSEDSCFTPHTLLELLKDRYFGGKVILVAEERLLNEDAGSLLKDLIRIGFPATTISERKGSVVDMVQCDTHLVAQTKKLAREATV